MKSRRLRSQRGDHLVGEQLQTRRRLLVAHRPKPELHDQTANARRLQRRQFLRHRRRRAIDQRVLDRGMRRRRRAPAAASAKWMPSVPRKCGCASPPDARASRQTPARRSVPPPRRSRRHRRCARPSIHRPWPRPSASSRPIPRSVSRIQRHARGRHGIALHIHHERVAPSRDLQHPVLSRRGADHIRMRLGEDARPQFRQPNIEELPVKSTSARPSTPRT